MAIKVKRAEGIVEFCTDQSARADWETACEVLNEARSSGSGRLADSALMDLAKAVQDAEGPMNDSMLLFRLRALPRRRWQELVTEHQPREDNEIDADLGVDQSQFFDAVMSEIGTVVSVNRKGSGEVIDFDPAEWNDLADEMSDGQWAEFAQKILELNRGVVGAPKSRTASRLIQSSEAN